MPVVSWRFLGWQGCFFLLGLVSSLSWWQDLMALSGVCGLCHVMQPAQGNIKESSEWVGALVPAAEFDVEGELTYAMIRICDMRYSPGWPRASH
jgi:hypothetical protein